ncbi:heterokaryon incompatibility protein-domain-containing protein [Xylariales sp. AK1849]|nr:heterokaryon incompatibility protein-domain-containing protein [Xylariales sp. AK1849]
MAQEVLSLPHEATPPTAEVIELFRTKVAFEDLNPAWVDVESLKLWLHTCDHNHGLSCRIALVPDDTVETRPQWLVDVRRKCLTPAGPDDQYAALSYVWGGVNITQTTTANLPRFLEPGALSSPNIILPRTIRHAIGLLEVLGVSFLWVDALCIVQDDEDIKRKQIHAMAWIYANAYVTIIAADGWDAEHGLRGVRGVTESRFLNKDSVTSVYNSLKTQAAKWYTRGWTFQEMIFSRRRIMFHNQVVLWECARASWNECVLNSIFQIPRMPIQPTVSIWPDIRQYMDAVRDYNMRQFTYPEDALKAISSLLSVWRHSFDGGFISGLPQMFFNEALLWQPEEPLQRRIASGRLGHQSSLPSWSWVGWEGAIDIDTWANHYSHLHLLPQYVNSGWIFQVKPSVHWFFTDSDGEMEAIKASSHKYRPKYKYGCVAPPGWKRLNRWPTKLPSYIYAGLEEPRSTYPLPLFRPPGAIAAANYLYGRTKRGCFRSDSYRPRNGLPSSSSICDEVFLLDSRGERMGVLRLNSNSFHSWRPAEQSMFELVEIAKGAVLGYESVNVWGDFGFELTEMPTPSREDTSEVSIVYVLWVEWEEGIAYRRGLGRVLSTSWIRDATDDIDLILG